MTVLLWLRDDLRLVDHPALSAACASGEPVVALWVHENRTLDDQGRPLGPRPLGAATRWWYHRSLQELSGRLGALGIPLVHAAGDPAPVLRRLVEALEPSAVHWTRRHAPAAWRRDAALKHELGRRTEVHSHPGSLLVEPWTLAPATGGHYRVFTPFHRAAAELPVGPTLPEPSPVAAGDAQLTRALAGLHAEGLLSGLDAIGLLDEGPAWWRDTLEAHWTPGELSATRRLAAVDEWLEGYATTRDLPADDDATSRISPALRCGELSPRQALLAARSGGAPGVDIAAWVRQLYWREFCWHLLHHVEHLEHTPLQPRFAAFPHEPDERLARAWRRGRTGIGLVDAGMQQLWQSGWMHNRVRMVTASFFTKNLLQPWQVGERWFWETLVDADEANNPVSWQWVAGCGADAAPYFRVFNPDLQAERFDPEGRYRARWLGGGMGGDERPEPVVDLAESRRRALEAYDQIRTPAAGGRA